MSVERNIDEEHILNPQRLEEDMVFLCYYLGRDNFLIELYEVLGSSGLMLLVDVFGGMSIQIPSREQMKIAIRDYNIFRKIEHAQSNRERKAIADDLSSQYELTRSSVYTIHKRVKDEIDRVHDSGLFH